LNGMGPEIGGSNGAVVNYVPEPGSLALLELGLAVPGRRRKDQAPLAWQK